jgi:hypothetical protein
LPVHPTLKINLLYHGVAGMVKVLILFYPKSGEKLWKCLLFLRYSVSDDNDMIMINDNIEMQIERKRIKNMYIRVKAPCGDVKITAPVSASDEEIRNFALSKLSWVKKRRKILANKPRPPVQQYESGENLWLLGNNIR